ncbi:[similarity to] T/U mismatch-specific DNA glycosylase [methanotrophic bacterial endosymbiont of Bathymodiolus sp.]|nr:[similarity to] T/U mismatch-specific DNA glycosylase [methanotrophic bacterial endosymbiont of Bathymodiolus sp.]
MAAMFNQDKLITYHHAEQFLKAQGIAVWDVLKSCARQGSLDSAIEKDSIEVNDFIALFTAFPQIKYVFLMGVWQKACIKNMFTRVCRLNIGQLVMQNYPQLVLHTLQCITRTN